MWQNVNNTQLWVIRKSVMVIFFFVNFLYFYKLKNKDTYFVQKVCWDYKHHKDRDMPLENLCKLKQTAKGPRHDKTELKH